IYTTEVFATVDQYGPDAFEDALRNPPLHRAVNGAVVAKRLGKLVPLTAGAHLVDDAVECRPLPGPWAPCRRWRIELVENVLNDFPQFVVHLPDRRQWFDGAFLSGHPWLLV